MRITIFGATGRTGRLVVQEALERGHMARAFTRSPDKLPADERERAGIEVVVGDVRDLAAVREAVAGADAVVSVLGPTANTPEYHVEQGTRHIVQAMQEEGVDRLLATAGAAVTVEDDRPGLVNAIIKGLLLLFSRHVYEDMRRTVAVIRNSELAWTVVRVPMLIDAPPTDDLRVGYVGVGTGPRVARADVARFVLDEIERGEHVHDAPVISR